MHIEFRPLKTSNCTEFKELLAIYHEAFPPEERQPDQVLQENVEREVSQAYIAKDASNVIFFLHAYSVPQTPLIFLDYAATHPSYRGNQISWHFSNRHFPCLETTGFYSANRKTPIMAKTVTPSRSASFILAV